jgi:radical SAM-linked protein
MSDPVYYDVRLRFARRGPAIWLAHLDMMRTFERSVRRAGLPMRWSEGFNPRPQMTFALPIGVGLATEDDYVDLSLTEDLDPSDVQNRLNPCLPQGLSILSAGRVVDRTVSVMSLIRAAHYLLDCPGLAGAVARIPNTQPLIVSKFSKGKTIQVDIRPLILDLQIASPDQIRLRVKAGSSANLRPDLFLKALVEYGELPAANAADCAITRLALLVESKTAPDAYVSPLELA